MEELIRLCERLESTEQERDRKSLINRYLYDLNDPNFSIRFLTATLPKGRRSILDSPIGDQRHSLGEIDEFFKDKEMKYLPSINPMELKWLDKSLKGKMKLRVTKHTIIAIISDNTGISKEVLERRLADKTIEELWRNPYTKTKMKYFTSFEPQLAHSDRELRAVAAVASGERVWIAEMKKDGFRVTVHIKDGEIKAFSRNKHEFKIDFKIPVKTNCILDGELLSKRGFRGNLSKEFDSVVFWDILKLGDIELTTTALWKRKNFLAEVLLDESQIMPFSRVKTEDDLNIIYKQARVNGEEGIVIKDPLSSYEIGRRTMTWLKYKPAVLSFEVRVRGPHELKASYFIESEDGTPLGWRGGGIKADQHEFIKIGTILEVRCDEIMVTDKGYGLRFPQLSRIRSDKDVANTIEEILEVKTNVKK